MKLCTRWIGPPPRVGDYLSQVSTARASTKKASTKKAYRIKGVAWTDHSVRWDQAAKAEVRVLKIVADRVAWDAVPPHARIHPWDRREAQVKGAAR